MRLFRLIRARRRMLLPLAATVGVGVFGSGTSCGGGSGSTKPPVATSYFLFATNTADNTMTEFAVDTKTGRLTKQSTVATGRSPVAVAFGGPFLMPEKCLYVLNAGDRTISQYEIFQDGTIQALTPPTVPAGQAPVAFLQPAVDGSIAVVDKGSNTLINYKVGDTGQLSASSTMQTGPGPVAATMLVDEICVLNSGNNTLSDFDATTKDGPIPSTPTATYPVGTGATALGWELGANTIGGLWVANQSARSISSLPTYWSFDSGLPSKITGGPTTTLITGHPVGIFVDHYVGTKQGDRSIYLITSEGQLDQYPLTGDETNPVPSRLSTVATGNAPAAVLGTGLELGAPFLYVANSGDGTISQYTLHNNATPPTPTGTPTASGAHVSALAFGQTDSTVPVLPKHGGISVPVK